MATTRSFPSTTSNRQVARVRPLRTTSPMARRSPWTLASKLILNSTVLTVEPRGKGANPEDAAGGGPPRAQPPRARTPPPTTPPVPHRRRRWGGAAPPPPPPASVGVAPPPPWLDR